MTTNIENLIDTSECRIESNQPCSYRLCEKADGRLVLQGCYRSWDYSKEWAYYEWRDIETVKDTE